ncbi:hypothetical protein, partial [Streptomyces sp. IBSBF 2390]|uniref:hypothetical protein n=1 Tax=Streptomyces sp. IBSBF 2390 TaxID=2903533 RepID=UPI002FDC2A0E
GVVGVGERVGLLGGDGRLVRQWIAGLMGNPALPASVLARLLTVAEWPDGGSSWLARCPLDARGTQVLVASAQTGHWLGAVENPAADVEVLARLVRDPVPRVRFAYAALVGDFGRRIPEGVLEVLAGDGQARIRRAVTRWDVPPWVRERLAGDDDAAVRAAAVTEQLWASAAPAVRESLLADPAPEVRDALAVLFAGERERG